MRMIIQESQVKEIYLRDGMGDWSKFHIKPWEGSEGFDLVIHSSFGVWSHNWAYPGPGGWQKFLSSLDRCYLFGKLTSKKEDSRDWEGLVKAWIIENTFGERWVRDWETCYRELKDLKRILRQNEGSTVSEWCHDMYNEGSGWMCDPNNWPDLKEVEYAIQRWYAKFWQPFIDHITLNP